MRVTFKIGKNKPMVWNGTVCDLLKSAGDQLQGVGYHMKRGTASPEAGLSVEALGILVLGIADRALDVDWGSEDWDIKVVHPRKAKNAKKAVRK